MLTICTWWWGAKYEAEHVERLAAGLRRYLKQPHRFVVVTDRQTSWTAIETIPIPVQDRALLQVRGCFARLRMFDLVWQKLNNMHERIACTDLDVVVTGDLDPLFSRSENFVILQGANAANPCPFNGSVWMLRAGYRPDVWTDFSLEAAAKTKHYEFPDDQGWFWHKLPNAAGWNAGSQSGIYAFQKPGWPAGSDDQPTDARLVVFPGWRAPDKFTHLPWVRKHWVCAT